MNFVLLFIIMFFVESVASTSTEKKQNKDLLIKCLMGFEIETSVFKTPHIITDMKIFTVKNNHRKPIWAFTSDTVDGLSKERESDSLFNIECKTLGGLDHESVTKASDEVEKTFLLLMELCREQMNNDTEIDEINLLTIPNFIIQWSDYFSDTKKFTILMSNKEDFHKKLRVYLHITYCLPLHYISIVFKRIGTLAKHASIGNFINKTKFRLLKQYEDQSESYFIDQIKNLKVMIDIKKIELENLKSKEGIMQSKISEYEESLKNLSSIYIATCRRLEKKTQNSIILLIDKLEEEENSPAIGLAYMFVYYVFSLFSNNTELIFDEPGPKTTLGIMSRVPFSEMYDGLSDEEKEKFKRIIEKNFKNYFHIKIRRYKAFVALTDDNLMDQYYILYDDQKSEHLEFKKKLKNNLINLGMWYLSVINVKKRIENRDLLSPPPGCHDDISLYSMGAYRNAQISRNYALIEVREYSNITFQNLPINLDNFKKMIDTESNWFFQIMNGLGGE